MNATAEQAWQSVRKSTNAQFYPRGKNTVLECLQFGGNSEFWSGFASEQDISRYFAECYAYAVQKIGFLKTDENIICAVSVTEPNRRNLFAYYLPITETWTTKPSTYREYERSFRVDLEPVFGNRLLADITRNELQNYLFGIVGENKHRKAEKLALMLNCIFDMAAEDFSIPSPMKKVVLPGYQVRRGQALTADEEERLVKYCKTHKEVEGTDALLVLLFFGLRKSELASIEIIDGKWLQCETSKERLGQNVALRKIPFTPQVKKVLPFIDFERAKNTNLNTISTRMKRLLPERHPHELRHTFISRCKECGVASEVVSIWAGHSLSGTITSTVYTHYSDEFQLKEAEKVIY